MKRALITGITGQDGSYLTELLLGLGYEVYGLIRRSSSFNTGRINHLYNHPRLKLVFGDLTDASVLCGLVNSIKPHEIYNLGAQSHVKTSFAIPVNTVEIDALGTLNLLEAVRACGCDCKFYQASSSEMFGNSPPPQDENTPFDPRSPYACAKVYSYYQAKNYREAYGMFICNGILFNHESPRRGETFVTRKITRAATRIKLGLQDKLELGNLYAWRDWGFAGDYVRAMFLMLQQSNPDDYVVATGEAHHVVDFLDAAFGILDLDWHEYVVVNQKYMRPSDVNFLKGDSSKARNLLKWTTLTGFYELVEMMILSDMELANRERMEK